MKKSAWKGFKWMNVREDQKKRNQRLKTGYKSRRKCQERKKWKNNEKTSTF